MQPTLNQPAFVKPLNGLTIRKEDGQPLPDGGDTVIYTTYWARRVQDGDVEATADLPKEKPAKKQNDTSLSGNAAATGTAN